MSSPVRDARSAVVVGGGLAGIATALRLADVGVRVTLVERQRRLGGATWSFRRQGLNFDNGQHVFLRCCTEYQGFLERIGTRGSVRLQPRLRIPVVAPGGRAALLWRAGLPAPLHLLPALASYRALAPLDRVRAVRAALALRRVDPEDPRSDSVAFGEWLSAHGQRPESLAPLWELVARPTINLPAESASLAMAAKVFRTGLLDTVDGADMGWSRAPLGELHGDAAATALERAGVRVLLGARVDAVRAPGPTGAPWGLSPAGQASAAGGPDLPVGTVEVLAEGTSLAADVAVVAVPHLSVAPLLPRGSVAVDPAALGTSPIVNVQVVYDRTVTDLEVAAGIGTPVQWVFDRTEATGCEEGQCLGVSLSAAEEWLEGSPEDLVERFVGSLAELFPTARRARVLDAVVTRERNATFRAEPGAAALRAGTRTAAPGVLLAGAWTATGWPATMEGAVRSGRRAAATALDLLGARHEIPEEVPA